MIYRHATKKKWRRNYVGNWIHFDVATMWYHCFDLNFSLLRWLTSTSAPTSHQHAKASKAIGSCIPIVILSTLLILKQQPMQSCHYSIDHIAILSIFLLLFAATQLESAPTYKLLVKWAKVFVVLHSWFDFLKVKSVSSNVRVTKLSA